MNKKNAVRTTITIFLILVCTLFVKAEIITVNVLDLIDKKPIPNAHIYYYLEDVNSRIIYEEYLISDSNGEFIITTNKSRYNLIIKLDKLDTLGQDGFFQAEIFLIDDSEINAIILPIGSLKGAVVDIHNRPIQNALVRVDCISEYGIQGVSKTNEIGSFNYKYLPSGQCRVGAAFDNSISFSDVNISSGNFSDIIIKLDVENDNNDTGLFLIIAIISAIVVLGIILLHKKILNKKNNIENKIKKLNIKKNKLNSKNNSKEENKTDKSEYKNKRASDILATMQGNERDVLKFLIENPNTTMAKIYYGTGIPKTSLARVLQTLESKNIITTEKIGKLKKVSLTDWFLEK